MNGHVKITGTCIPAILNVSRYQTVFELWQRLTGRAEPVEENANMRIGKKVEKLVFEKICQEEKISDGVWNDVYIEDKQYDFFGGTPDGIYGDNNIIECKSTFQELHSVPDEWYAQIQWYLGLLGGNEAILGVLSLPGDPKKMEFLSGEQLVQIGELTKFKIERNDEFIEVARNQALYFYENFILTDKPPRIEDYILYESHKIVNPFNIEASPEIYDVYLRLKEIKQKKSRLELEETELEERIKLFMGSARQLMWNGKVLVSRKLIEYFKIDDKLAKDNVPDIEAYMKKVSYVRLTIK